LFHGKKIHMSEALINAGHGVDTEADLVEVRRLLTQ
ncbi:MAG TPA: 3-deoxy-manno-octulosonate cytidylyltransferase, partial [Methylophaga aminisulfidivorans]|nr:3-deoxy-manno-octulosonate cytidylyltransferase [Methylophaga aminisulfidivorans]